MDEDYPRKLLATLTHDVEQDRAAMRDAVAAMKSRDIKNFYEWMTRQSRVSARMAMLVRLASIAFTEAVIDRNQPAAGQEVQDG
jgi:FKBP-type peptidyl-prolyl cis-trans isomerase 2